MVQITKLNNTVEITSNGHDGQNGNNGYSGGHGEQGYDASNGGDGKNGSDAKDASNLTIKLSSTKTPNIIQLETNDYQMINFPITDNINLKAEGGNGGKGGNGGSGGKGGDGRDGSSATPHYHGGNGGDGGNGGRGGNGGHGGDGGNGASIKLILDPADLDLAMLVSPHYQGGEGGLGGKSGQGGQGGAAGRGGSGTVWQETRHGVDAQGYSIAHTYTHTEYSGLDGREGKPGYNGKQGTSGQNGQSGSFVIQVNDELYEQYYDLEIIDYDVKYNSNVHDNVIEPGEELKVDNLVVKNTGGMPSPSPITIGMINSSWIHPEGNHIKLTKSLLPGEEYKFKHSFHFKINQADRTVGKLQTTDNISFYAYLPRIKKYFENFDLPKTITITYPVDLSTIASIKTVSFAESAPFAIKIRNNSNQAIGPSHRKLSLTVSTTAYGKERRSMVDLDIDGSANYYDLSKPYQKDIDELKPGQVFTFAGLLKFNDHQLPPYSTACISFSLKLENMQSGEMQLIDKQNLNLKLANAYEYDDEADFVLVINSAISNAVIEKWKNAALELGCKLSIWDTTLYSGLSYTQKRHDQQSFMTQLKDKVVIILNNNKVTDTLKQGEIYNAAREANISTYVINNFDMRNIEVPSRNPVKTITPNEVRYLVKNPCENDLRTQTEQIVKSTNQSNPNKTYIAAFRYEPKLISTFKYQLGAIDLYEGLDCNKVQIAYSNQSLDEVNNENVATMAKLLPFSSKLALLANSGSKNKFVLRQAILSDLTSELKAFTQYEFSNQFNEQNISSALAMQSELFRYNVRRLLSMFEEPRETTNKYISSENINHFVYLLLEYEYEIKRLPTLSDKWLLPWTKMANLITNTSLVKIDNWLKKNITNYKFVIEQRERIEKERKRWDRDHLYQPNLDKDKQTTYHSHNRVLAKRYLPSYRNNKSSFFTGFTEGKYILNSKSDRQKQMAKMAAECEFDSPSTRIN